MNDKQFTRFLFIMLALFLAWWLFHRRTSGATVAPNGTPMGTYNDPQLLTYAANPSKFGPQTVNGSVNIAVNGYNGLNQNYMPIFGFVGMAQGETYQ
jgi:hypothetical protein